MTDCDALADVLLVEDHADVAEALVTVLGDTGYRVAWRVNGRDALGYLHATRVLPQLILLDLAMPIMNGFEFRAHQRRDARLQSIPVVIISDTHDVAVVDEFLAAAAYGPKTGEMSDLLAIVADYVRPHTS